MKEEKKHSIRTIIFIVLIIIVLIVLWARYINTKGLKVNEYGIINESLPASFNGLKIVHFSDIHVGNTTNIDDIKNIVTKINELKPDIVFFTGDLFNKNIKLSEKELSKIKKELSKIEATLYKYAVIGDIDQKEFNTYKELMEESEFILLNNSNELLYYKSETPIKIVGLTNTKELEDAFKEETTTNSFCITLLHKPDTIEDLSDYKIDLAFAGHSLGGQLKLPFLGGIVKKDGAEKYIDGKYKINNAELYVSSGIGTDNFKFRLFNKPSINLYRIYNK